jgi:uncharacterized protein YcnI
MKSPVFSLIIILVLFVVPGVSAHVVVTPAEVGVGAFQTFNVGVPNEKDISTVMLRLVLPKRLEHVSPNVKPGWNIEVKKAGGNMKGEILNTGEKAPDPETVTEIVWTGGPIPAGQRDDFLFSAKVPAETGELTWMAYQTYADGTTVSWDSVGEAGHNEGSEDPLKGPASKTKIINDLNPQTTPAVINEDGTKENLTLALAVLAIIIALASFVIELKKR